MATFGTTSLETLLQNNGKNFSSTDWAHLTQTLNNVLRKPLLSLSSRNSVPEEKSTSIEAPVSANASNGGSLNTPTSTPRRSSSRSPQPSPIMEGRISRMKIVMGRCEVRKQVNKFFLGDSVKLKKNSFYI